MVLLVKLDPLQSCYPYTYHSKHTIQSLEVTFLEKREETHSVKFYGQPVGYGIPFYRFTKREDYMEFQTQVHGEELIDYFDVRRIDSAASSPEATNQHLKIWQNRITKDHSISFYASASRKATDLEFPISMFNKDIDIEDRLFTDLDFVVANESKRGISISKKTSRSFTEKSGSSFTSPGMYNRSLLPDRFR